MIDVRAIPLDEVRRLVEQALAVEAAYSGSDRNIVPPPGTRLRIALDALAVQARDLRAGFSR